MSVTYYVVVHFDWDAEGALRPGAPRDAADRAASFLVREHAGAVAFSRTGDPTTGEFQDAIVLAQYDRSTRSQGG